MMLVNEQASASQGESHILHPGSRAVFRAWDGFRKGAPLPARDDIDLGALRPHIGNLFIIERAAGSASFRWRLAGTGLTEIYRRDLTGETVLSGWDRFERNVIERFLNGVAEELQPCVLRYRLHTDSNQMIGAELLGLPVAARSGGVHIFGGLFAFRDVSVLGHGRIAAMELSGARGVWSEHLPGDDETATTMRHSAKGFRPFQVITGGRT
jgi:hypothetical protein